MKWYTCTPVAFKGDHTFFCRDSGLFCKSFQQIGVESKAIMPLPSFEHDDPDLIRTEYHNLSSPEWWKALNIDGIILYAWGDPKYTSIARAIHEAGIYLVIYMDCSGLDFPWAHWKSHATYMLQREIYVHGKAYGTFRFLARIAVRHSIKLLDRGRKKHLSYADLILFPTPLALSSVQQRAWLYGEKITSSLRMITCPVSHLCSYKNTEKENIVIAVGRWDDLFQKRPDILMQTLEQAAKESSNWRFEIYGNTPDFLHQWHRSLPGEIREKIHLCGLLHNKELLEKYNQAKILICTSRFESTHIVAAEALSAGCSVVAPKIQQLVCYQWYVSHHSGTLSPTDSPADLCSGLLEEMHQWDNGHRNAHSIAAHWSNLFHATKSCERIIAEYQAAQKESATNTPL